MMLATKPLSAAFRSNSHPKKSKAYHEAAQIQTLIADSAQDLRKDIASASDSDSRARASSALAQLAKSWDTLEQRKRILRGLGNPKSVEARNAKPRRKVKAETIATEDSPAKESL